MGPNSSNSAEIRRAQIMVGALDRTIAAVREWQQEGWQEELATLRRARELAA
jgi:hypothetical protein